MSGRSLFVPRLFAAPRLVAAAVAACALAHAADASAVGEAIAGFPNWAERVEHEWTNRARVDPALEMAKCGAPCGEKACYSVKPPVYWSDVLSHSARFHSKHMSQNGYFSHPSACALVSNINSLYPGSCNAPASCSCVGGTLTGTTDPFVRIGMFGGSGSGEIIATPSDPNTAFYLWLYENSTPTACTFSSANGHRWLILTSTSNVGYGVDGYSTGDFGGGGTASKIASGSHYPRSGASVELWANWYDTAAPTAAQVNLGGTCQNMALTRGTGTNGAYLYTAAGLSGCVRYYFSFKDSAGTLVTWPTTGSLGLGPAGTCADWDTSRPAACGSTVCTPSCSGKTCGPDGCGGSCGSCTAPATCSAAGTCVCTPSCGGKTCGGDGCGGSCGSCKAPETCGATGACVCAAPDLKCGAACLDVTSDPANCGACGKTCAASEVCNKSACSSTCSAPLVACSGACVDLKTDSLHCGKCDVSCTPTQLCVDSVCKAKDLPDAGPGPDVGTDPDAGVYPDVGTDGAKDDVGSAGDAGAAFDSGALGGDASSPPGDDPEASALHGSCGCAVAGGPSGSGDAFAAIFVGLAGLLWSSVRRRRTARQRRPR